MAEEKELRPIATRVLYEDDEVRIWDQRIGAGETLGRHRHDCDYVIVTVRGGGPIDVEFHDGTGGELGDAITLPRSQRGEALFVRKGHVETAHNRGDGFRAVLVELKRNDKAGPAES
jgi:hypothetical protein